MPERDGMTITEKTFLNIYDALICILDMNFNLLNLRV